MTRFLSTDFFELLARESRHHPVVEGADADLDLAVPGAPDGDVVVRLEIRDGHLVAHETDPAQAAPLQLSCPHDLAVELLTRETSVAVAFMQGRLKVNGDMPAMHRLLPLTARGSFDDLLERVAAATEV